MTFKIPLCKPHHDIDKELIEIRKVIESGVLTGGDYTRRFEEKFAEYVSVEKCVAVNSCASALQLSILANMHEREISWGEILVPSFTFVASANSIENARCRPIFCDIHEDTLNIDVNSIDENDLDNCCGIMPVNIAGLKYDSKVNDFAEEMGMFVVEDSAEMIMKNQGSFDVTCFSFFPTKNITTGEGGMVATDRGDVAKYCKLGSSHGVVKSNVYERDVVMPGFNFRITEIQSALGLVQLGMVDEMNDKRRGLAKYYNKKLKKFGFIRTPTAKVDDSTWQMYIIRVGADIRDRLLTHLRDNSVEASVHFDPILSKTTYFKTNQSLPIAEKVSKEVVTLPIFPDLEEDEVDFIIGVIESFEEKNV